MLSSHALSFEAEDYFRTLPGLRYPQALIHEFPRIANEIADLRYDEVRLQAYFETLLSDGRGGRTGFSSAVVLNLQQLRDAMTGVLS